MRWLNRVDHFLDRLTFHISRSFNFVALAVVLIMILYVVSDVIMRAVFHMPRMGSIEAVNILMTVVFAWGVGWTQKVKGHIVIDLLFNKFGPGIQRVVNSAVYFICFVFMSALAWKVFLKAMEVKASNMATLSKVQPFGILPIWPFHDIVALSLAVLALVFLADFVHSLVHLPSRGGAK